MTKFYPELSTNERLQLLQDNADDIKQEKYVVALTQEELDQKREQLVNQSIKATELEDSLKLIKDQFKEQIDPLKREIKELLNQVKTKQETREGNTYYIANHQTSMMEVYDGQGELVHSRRLLPEEKQKTIMSALRPASNM